MVYSKYVEKPIPYAEIVENNLRVDWKLFKKLLKHRSFSLDRSQEEFAKWLVKWMSENIEGLTITRDGYGNIYVVKGEADIYPCVVAHIDINQDESITDVSVIQTDKLLLGIDNATGKQTGLGFDDKTGVYFGILMLQTLDVVKCFFPKDEEAGCIGTKAANMKWFNNCSMLVQLDRNSYSNDISESTNSVMVVSDEFKAATKTHLAKYGYEWEWCIYTDVGELVKQGCGCVAMNIS